MPRDRCAHCNARLNTVLEGVALKGTFDFQYTGVTKIKKAFCCLDCMFDYIYEEYICAQTEENHRDD